MLAWLCNTYTLVNPSLIREQYSKLMTQGSLQFLARTLLYVMINQLHQYLLFSGCCETDGPVICASTPYLAHHPHQDALPRASLLNRRMKQRGVPASC